jgi:2-succinyl-6-hydroxy-2,4-cyclohexadiene-1-carboxylate synthase
LVERTRLVLVHGFNQTGRSWDTVTSRLPEGFDVVALDAPGHAGVPVAADLWGAAEMIASVGGRATYVGYSMGARLALHVALAHPGLVERLALLGSTPGIRDLNERAERRRSDDSLAASIVADGVEAFLDRWLANPMFAGLGEAAAQRDDRLRNTAEGLAGSLRTCGTGAQDDLWPRLAELDMPTLLMAGADDQKFADIAAEMAPLIGAHATVRLVEQAGHAAHLEQPGRFVELVVDWLGTTS